jgi:hypothetical protein
MKNRRAPSHKDCFANIIAKKRGCLANGLLRYRYKYETASDQSELVEAKRLVQAHHPENST